MEATSLIRSIASAQPEQITKATQTKLRALKILPNWRKKNMEKPNIKMG
jgi:hypothetical protein